MAFIVKPVKPRVFFISTEVLGGLAAMMLFSFLEFGSRCYVMVSAEEAFVKWIVSIPEIRVLYGVSTTSKHNKKIRLTGSRWSTTLALEWAAPIERGAPHLTAGVRVLTSRAPR
jgi:uncharacterized membrane protein YhfC